MPTSNEKFLVGLVGPDVLSAIEEDSLNPVFLDLQACNALEIRYDFFEQSQWPGLSARLRSARSGRFGLAAKVSTGHPRSPFLAKKGVPPNPLPKFADLT